MYSFRMLSHKRKIAKNKKSKGLARKIFKVTEKYSCPLSFIICIISFKSLWFLLSLSREVIITSSLGRIEFSILSRMGLFVSFPLFCSLTVNLHLKLSGIPSRLTLKKQRFKCKQCNKKFVARTSLILKHCHISQNVKLSILKVLTATLSFKKYLKNITYQKIQQ